MPHRHLTSIFTPLALLWWLSGQEVNRQVTLGTVIPSTGAQYSFQHVVGVEVGPDGSILVLDPTEKAVLRFGALGEYRGRIGREGAGPGEFTWPLRMGMLKDQLWVLDAQLRRLNVFDKQLSPLRTQHLEQLALASPLDGGAMVMQPIGQPPSPLARVDTATVALLLVHADGRTDRVASWMIDPAPLAVRFTGFTATARQPLLDAPLWDAARDGRSIVVIGRGETGYPSLVAVSATGKTIFRKPIPWPRVPVTSALYDHTVDSMVRHFERTRPSTASGVTVDRDAVRRAVRRPRDLSAVAQVRTGTDGRIWVRRRTTSTGQWVGWHSFGADGSPESSVLVPAAVEVHLITNRSLWGVVRGEDGEPRVVEYLFPPSLQRQ